MQLPYKIDFKSERNDMIESNLLNTNDNNTVYYDFNYNIYKIFSNMEKRCVISTHIMK